MAMTQHQEHLWNCLQSLALDGPQDSHSLHITLQREHGWTRPYAQRVVAEYRRFLLLASSAHDGMMVPSDAVDQAWHRHLLDTRAYWHRLCGEVLGRPLHHIPSRGGRDEEHRYRARYAATLCRYREVFGEEPPRDIWPEPDARFAGRYPCVNRDAVRLLRRPRWPALAAAAVGLLPLAACTELSDEAITTMWVLGIVLILIIASVTRDSGRDRRRHRGGCGGWHLCGDGGCGGGCGGGD